MLEVFKEFYADKHEPVMYITGVAGTGKTTSLNKAVQWVLAKDEEAEIIVCAHTHKAVKVLRSKLTPHKRLHLCTLHSFLKKRPTVNTLATEINEVDGNAQVDFPESPSLLFIDEFSMVGEKDYVDINAMQVDEEGKLLTKVIYIGDPNQLPPVKDVQVIKPQGKYWVKLAKIYRQEAGNPLIDTLMQINGFINGEEARPLLVHDAFERGIDIVEKYLSYRTDNKVMLAYTNAKVQELNAKVQGRDLPVVGDKLFSPTDRVFYTLLNVDDKAYGIVSPTGDILELNSKYKTLETIHDMEDLKFYHVEDADGNETVRAVIFGHSSFLERQEALARTAVFANRAIEQAYPGTDAKAWSNANWQHKLAKERKAAWRDYLAFKQFVMCMDFTHAMTVHKSQGSTYDYVFLDTEDMSKCADRDYIMYLRLMYVAVSRAAKKVYTN